MVRPFLWSLCFIFWLVAPGRAVQAQESITPLEELKTLEDTLGVLAYLIRTDSLEQNRFAATRKMIPTLVKALKVKGSFTYPFDRLESVSIQYPPDSTFRIFTWQLFVNDNEYRYYGAIQINSEELQLFPLIDRSFEIEDPSHEVLSADRWYGALYYRLMPVTVREQTYYLLFGFDAHSFFRRSKLIDVLSFDASGRPVFGAPILPSADGSALHRFVLEYSAEASVRLNYDESMELIIFDHLIPMKGKYGEGVVNVPDGSYEAYRIEADAISYLPKVFDQVSEEAPRPFPIQGVNDKDILGRPKKKN